MKASDYAIAGLWFLAVLDITIAPLIRVHSWITYVFVGLELLIAVVYASTMWRNKKREPRYPSTVGSRLSARIKQIQK